MRGIKRASGFQSKRNDDVSLQASHIKRMSQTLTVLNLINLPILFQHYGYGWNIGPGHSLDVVSVPHIEYIIRPKQDLTSSDKLELDSELRRLAPDSSDVYASSPPLDKSIIFWVATLPQPALLRLRAHKMV